MLGAALVGGCGEGAAEPPGPYWMEGVSADAVAQHLKVELPAVATAAKAARQRGHDDLLLLSFVLPTSDVDGFLDGLAPEHPVRQGIPFAGETGLFDRLGLPDPVSAPGVRETQVCAPCVKRDLDFLQLAVAPVDGKSSRVYLRAVD
ncbi:hypothetical protein [Streptomyces sp. NPDC058157]|uniref:hypothetical protein n=1 Tax=Streptomyces sp. NPDC058157 TaxID=3346360 RepID=UPI0036E1D303